MTHLCLLSLVSLILTTRAQRTHHIRQCAVGDVDISSLLPVETIRPQHYHTPGETYTWVFGFCDKVLEAPAGSDTCSWEGGAGYLQQFNGDKCVADFNKWGGIQKFHDGSHTGLTVHVSQVSPNHNKVARVDIICDKLATGDIAEADMEYVEITDDDKNSKQLDYHLRFRSACACPGSPCGTKPHPSLKSHIGMPPSNMFEQCKSTDIDLGHLSTGPAYQFTAPQVINDKETNFSWAFGWCSPVWSAPSGDSCPAEMGVGYLQQFTTDGKCAASFTNFYHFGEVTTPETGVEIQVFDNSGLHVKKANIFVLCDVTAAQPALKDNAVYVSYEDDAAGEKMYIYHLTFHHRCACPNQCFGNADNGAAFPLPDQLPVREVTTVDWETEVKDCKIGNRDLRTLATKEWVAKQHWKGHDKDDGSSDVEYVWLVGFCTPIANSPTGLDPCFQEEGMGYVQQFHDTSGCESDCTVFKGLQHNSSGVIITTENNVGHKTRRRSQVYVECDPHGKNGEVHQLHHGPVVVHDDNDGTVVYNFGLKSKCACEDGCSLEKECRVGHMSIRDLLPKDNILTTTREGASDSHTWVIGWCSKLDHTSASIKALATADPCDKPGYVQQFGAGTCLRNFHKNFNMYHGQNGIVIEAESDEDWEGRHVARVQLVCDENLQPAELHHSSDVEVVPNKKRTVWYYTVTYKSKCACDGGCMELSKDQKPVALPDMPTWVNDLPTAHKCKWGEGDDVIDFSGLTAWEGLIDQRLDGKNTPFMWVFGWCQQVFDAPTGMTPCDFEGGAGYVQQYHTGEEEQSDKGCRADFKSNYQTKDIKDGRMFTYEMKTTGHHHAKKMMVHVHCNKQGLENTVSLDKNYAKVELKHDTYEYEVHFKSKCACPGGCDGDKNKDNHKSNDNNGLYFNRNVYQEFPRSVDNCMMKDPLTGETTSIYFLSQKEWIAKQKGGEGSGMEYTWVTGFCTPVGFAESSVDACAVKSGEGFLHQYHQGHCQRQFNQFGSVSLHQDADGTKYIEVNATDSERRNIARIQVFCDPNGKYAEVHHMDNEIPVNQIDAHHYEYIVRFRSLCGCPEGCGAAAMVKHWASTLGSHSAAIEKCRADNPTNVDLTKLPDYEWVAKEKYERSDGTVQYEEYYWYMTLCGINMRPPAGKEACDDTEHPGYFQQFNQGKCVANFNKGGAANTTRLKDQDGIEILVRDETSSRHKKQARIRILCNRAVPPGTYHFNQSAIPVKELSDTDLEYSPVFYSSDICTDSSCGIFCTTIILIIGAVLIYVVVGVAFNKFIRGKAGIDAFPNLDLWLALPSLIAGCFSSIGSSGFSGGASSGQKYDPVSTTDDDGMVEEEDDQYL